MRLIDADALIDEIKHKLWDWESVDGITATTVLKQTITDIENQPTAMLKEQEAEKPRVSNVEQRCGNCNKVIEMDGWKACPWCGKPILWEAVGRSVK